MNELPNYQCASYKLQATDWLRLDDIYNGIRAWTAEKEGTLHPNAKTGAYLRREPEEDDDSYITRLNTSPFQDKFAQAIRDFVGILFVNGIVFNDVPPIILSHLQNIDNQGTHYSVFFHELAIAAMKWGHVFVHVDCVPYVVGEDINLYDAGARRPYWVSVSPAHVPNFRTQTSNGQTSLSQVTIEQSVMVPDGKYGEKQDTTYLRLVPGFWEKSRIEKLRDGNLIENVFEAGSYGVARGDRIDPLPFVPLIAIYGGDRVGFFHSRPPLKSLAELNIAHYQIGSDHRQKMHLCCFPQPVTVGTMDADRIVLGPRAVVQLPPGGSFAWAEPRAESLAHSRQELQDIETTIDFLSASYLVKPADRQAAMVSIMQATKLESSLYQFATNFVAGINAALAIHAAYLGLSSGGTVSLSAKYLDQQKDPQLLLAYVNLYSQLENLSTERQTELLKLVGKENG